MSIVTISTNPTDYKKYNINFADLNNPVAHLHVRAINPAIIFISLPTDDIIPDLCPDVYYMVDTYDCKILGANKSNVLFKRVKALYKNVISDAAIRMYSLKNYTVAKVVEMNDMS
jgi:hypothetical protein